MRLRRGEARLVVDVVERGVPATAELEPLVGHVGGREGDDECLVGAEREASGGGQLRGQSAGGAARGGERVGFLVAEEPLGERDPRAQSSEQGLAEGAPEAFGALEPGFLAHGAEGVESAQAGAAGPLGVPVGVHLADGEHRGAGVQHHVLARVALVAVVTRRPHPEGEGAVRGDVERTVVEGGAGAGAVVGGVVAGEHLERQVGGGAPFPLDLVRRAVDEPCVGVERVRVVETHLGVRAGGLEQLRVRPAAVLAVLDHPAQRVQQVLESLGDVGLRAHVRRRADHPLGLRQRLGQWRGGTGGVRAHSQVYGPVEVMKFCSSICSGVGSTTSSSRRRYAPR